jgi:membrane associated rhomboid family serine protease
VLERQVVNLAKIIGLLLLLHMIALAAFGYGWFAQPSQRSLLPLVLFAGLFTLPLVSTWRARQRAKAALQEDRVVYLDAIAGNTHADRALGAALFNTRPVATYATLLVIVASSLWGLHDDAYLTALAKDNALVRSGEVWRLLTPMLVHGSAMHLVMNAMMWLSLGRFVEGLYGPRLSLALGLGSVVAGSLTSVVFVNALSVGASGGVYGLMGCMVAFGLEHRATLPPTLRASLVRGMGSTIAINIAFTFLVPNIDWAAHLGGLVFGAVAGYLLPEPRYVRFLQRQATQPQAQPS